MKKVSDYTQYIPSPFSDKRIYKTVLEIFLKNYVDIANIVEEIIPQINKESLNPYTLNMLGEIFNVSRFVTPPLYNPGFSWNIKGLGWNQVNWTKIGKEYTLVDDVLYRWLLVFRTGLTLWDGTSGGLINLLNSSFPTVNFVMIDNFDNTVTIYCYFNDDTAYSLKQLFLNGALQLNLTGTKINWEEATKFDFKYLGFKEQEESNTVGNFSNSIFYEKR